MAPTETEKANGSTSEVMDDSLSKMDETPTGCLSCSYMKGDFPSDVPSKVPHIVDIKRVLPKHCFEPTLLESFAYVIRDLTFAVALYFVLLLLEQQHLTLLKYFYLPVYWFLQGTVMWAIFVLAHDCGHGSFSHYPLLNDVIGTLLNTFIMVPFYPWKLSHKHHHRNTGNIDKDEVFYPVRKRHQKAGNDLHLLPGFGAGLSWWMYLVMGYSPRKHKHLNPFDPMFHQHAFGCIMSLTSLVLWLAVLYKYFCHLGLLALVSHYVIPLMIFSSWLVIVTFLHHNDVQIPWYGDEKWDNVRGQLSSVDRHYGWAHGLTHNIGTHQIHHLFIKIPHYRLEEATSAFRRSFPELVRINNENILLTFYRMFNIFQNQRHISDNANFHVYHRE